MCAYVPNEVMQNGSRHSHVYVYVTIHLHILVLVCMLSFVIFNFYEAFIYGISVGRCLDAKFNERRFINEKSL